MKTAIELIAEERQRQIVEEGWTPEHDDLHQSEAMALAAACYALPLCVRQKTNIRILLWPWSDKWWKPTTENRERELVKAGALIAAELDRVIRSKNNPNHA